MPLEGPLAGLAPVGAVSSVASDRQQHPLSGVAGGVGDREPGVAGAVAQRTASVCGLDGAVWPSPGDRGDVRGSGTLPGHGLPRGELGAGGVYAGFRAPQRIVHGPTRIAEGDVRAGAAARCAPPAGRPGGPAGVGVPRHAGALRADGVALATRRVCGAAGQPPRTSQRPTVDSVCWVWSKRRLRGSIVIRVCTETMARFCAADWDVVGRRSVPMKVLYDQKVRVLVDVHAESRLTTRRR